MSHVRSVFSNPLRLMAKCDYCGTSILFGGVKDGDLRFCNDQCHAGGQLLAIAQQIPPDLLEETVRETHQGNCPKCRGRGPVDVHTSHRVWSALLLTNWSSRPQVCCRSCGVKSKLGDMVFSGVLGWWGFPWGIIVTPVQIIRNFFGMFGGPDPARPSKELEHFVRLMIAENAARQAAVTQSPTASGETSE
ncbi:MAG: hypothetical protein KDN19_13220 [Verrucomicrobiae bacterium]|nr:hypothetical protein [Verrucomicrobiae bacterium]